MYDADMAKVAAFIETSESGTWRVLILGLMTCGMGLCCTDGGLGQFHKDLRAYIMDMNRRYEPYVVTWSMEFIPYDGTYIMYET